MWRNTKLVIARIICQNSFILWLRAPFINFWSQWPDTKVMWCQLTGTKVTPGVSRWGGETESQGQEGESTGEVHLINNLKYNCVFIIFFYPPPSLNWRQRCALRFFREQVHSEGWHKINLCPFQSPHVRQTTRLSCSARGNPPPTLYWTSDGRVLTDSHTTRIITKK